MESWKTVAFVSGNEEQQEGQKSEILKRCEKRGFILPADDDFFSDWETMLKQLEGKGVIVITDLRVLSADPTEIVNRVLVLLEHRIRIEVIDENHSDLLKRYQPEQLTKNQLEFLKPRLRKILEQRMS